MSEYKEIKLVKQWDGLPLNLNRRPFFGQYGDDELPVSN